MNIAVDRGRATGREEGFTLIELLVSVAILMVVSSLMLRGTLDMSLLNAQQANRSELHAGIRNATALLQQEVGQAGRIAFPTAITLSNAALACASTAVGASGTSAVGRTELLVRDGPLPFLLTA